MGSGRVFDHLVPPGVPGTRDIPQFPGETVGNGVSRGDYTDGGMNRVLTAGPDQGP